jgi:hypothetical protein
LPTTTATHPIQPFLQPPPSLVPDHAHRGGFLASAALQLLLLPLLRLSSQLAVLVAELLSALCSLHAARCPLLRLHRLMRPFRFRPGALHPHPSPLHAARASAIQHPASSIQHPASSLPLPASMNLHVHPSAPLPPPLARPPGFTSRLLEGYRFVCLLPHLPQRVRQTLLHSLQPSLVLRRHPSLVFALSTPFPLIGSRRPLRGCHAVRHCSQQLHHDGRGAQRLPPCLAPSCP